MGTASSMPRLCGAAVATSSGMGKKSDKGNHVGRAGHMEQRKDQAVKMREQSSKRNDQKISRGVPPSRRSKSTK